jgi:hypothetical protein
MADNNVGIRSTLSYLKCIEEHLLKYWSADNLRAFERSDGGKFPDNERLRYKVGKVWYRGQADDWPIIPKVYRHQYDEREMLLDTRRRASLIQGTPLWDDYVGWYFSLQHHGFPTRLVDWTESSLVGLYFAVADVFDYESSGRLSSFRPLVWLIHPNAEVDPIVWTKNWLV